MSGFRALYVWLIFLVPWIGVPCGFYFGKIKKTQEEWRATKTQRDTARGSYGGDTAFAGLWPDQGQESLPKFQPGKADQEAQQTSFDNTRVRLEAELEASIANKAIYEGRLDREIAAHMIGINRTAFDYQKPDEFMYELLYTQRDREGPHLIQWLEKNYKGLFIVFPINIPTPPITPYQQPATGPEGRLEWPVGAGGIPMTVYGKLDEILNFLETFPDRYNRTAQFVGCSLTREAFDYQGSVLMRLDTTLFLFVWPENPPAGGAAGGPGAAPGGSGIPGIPALPTPGGTPGGAPPGPAAGSGGTSAGATPPSGSGPPPAGETSSSGASEPAGE